MALPIARLAACEYGRIDFYESCASFSDELSCVATAKTVPILKV